MSENDSSMLNGNTAAALTNASQPNPRAIEEFENNVHEAGPILVPILGKAPAVMPATANLIRSLNLNSSVGLNQSIAS